MAVALTDALIQGVLEKMPRMRIGLLGDLFLDRYFEIDPRLTEVSIETGLDAWQVERVRNQPGALGTVMSNLAAMGVGALYPVTVIGEDGLGDDLCRALQSLPVDSSGIIRLEHRMTPTYLKPLVIDSDRVPRELNRFDIRSRCPLPQEAQQQIIDRLNECFTEVDGWVVLDQIARANEGVVSDHVRRALRNLVQCHPQVPVIIDSRSQLGAFDFGCVKGNRDEFRHATDADVANAAEQFARNTARPVYVTTGRDGIWVAQPDGTAGQVPTIELDEPIDIVGAGDSATAALIVGMIANLPPLAAAEFANVVASITVQQCGTTGTANPRQIRARWEEWPL